MAVTSARTAFTARGSALETSPSASPHFQEPDAPGLQAGSAVTSSAASVVDWPSRTVTIGGHTWSRSAIAREALLAADTNLQRRVEAWPPFNAQPGETLARVDSDLDEDLRFLAGRQLALEELRERAEDLESAAALVKSLSPVARKRLHRKNVSLGDVERAVVKLLMPEQEIDQQVAGARSNARAPSRDNRGFPSPRAFQWCERLLEDLELKPGSGKSDLLSTPRRAPRGHERSNRTNNTKGGLESPRAAGMAQVHILAGTASGLAKGTGRDPSPSFPSGGKGAVPAREIDCHDHCEPLRLLGHARFDPEAQRDAAGEAARNLRQALASQIVAATVGAEHLGVVRARLGLRPLCNLGPTAPRPRAAFAAPHSGLSRLSARCWGSARRWRTCCY